jgi:hypothetical protein
MEGPSTFKGQAASPSRVSVASLQLSDPSIEWAVEQSEQVGQGDGECGDESLGVAHVAGLRILVRAELEKRFNVLEVAAESGVVQRSPAILFCLCERVRTFDRLIIQKLPRRAEDFCDAQFPRPRFNAPLPLALDRDK